MMDLKDEINRLRLKLKGKSNGCCSCKTHKEYMGLEGKFHKLEVDHKFLKKKLHNKEMEMLKVKNNNRLKIKDLEKEISKLK